MNDLGEDAVGEFPDGYTEYAPMKPWLIAEDIEIHGVPVGMMNGRFIVDDIEERGDTTTYKLVRPSDGVPSWGDLID